MVLVLFAVPVCSIYDWHSARNNAEIAQCVASGAEYFGEGAVVDLLRKLGESRRNKLVPINVLPDDPRRLIFTYLNARNLIRSRRVNRQWNKDLHNSVVWRHAEVRFGIPSYDGDEDDEWEEDEEGNVAESENEVVPENEALEEEHAQHGEEEKSGLNITENNDGRNDALIHCDPTDCASL